jgi:hypothetical protein
MLPLTYATNICNFCKLFWRVIDGCRAVASCGGLWRVFKVVQSCPVGELLSLVEDCFRVREY